MSRTKRTQRAERWWRATLSARAGATKWLFNWQKRDWTTTGGTPVSNDDLWRRLAALIAQRRGALRFVWVRGHAADFGNNMSNALANQATTRDDSE